MGFLNQLNDFEFALLVCIFASIFTITDVLFNMLQKKSLDINYCLSQIENTRTLLNTKRNDQSFNHIFDLAALRVTVPTEQQDGQTSVNSGSSFSKI